MTTAPSDQKLARPKPHQLNITVLGIPAPQGSKRHVGNGVMIESNKDTLTTWREDVKHAAVRALREHPSWERDYPAVRAYIIFTLPRPKGHFRTGKFAHLLRETAPVLHGSKPDLDKLLRSTGDALTAAGVYRDDSRLAQVFAVKVYTSAEGRPGLDRPGMMDKPGAQIVLQAVSR